MNAHPPNSVGLCLSGGGYRASLFHLGVLRYLAEAGQLSNVCAMSTVSGGSIVGSFLATKWAALRDRNFSLDAFMQEVYDPFARLVTTRNFRDRWLVLCLLTLPLLLNPRFTWINIWAWLFDRWFYGRKQLNMHELPEGPDLVINATELESAKLYRFARTFRGDDRRYEENMPYGRHSVRVSDAVTASSAHLPIRVTSADGRGLWFMDGGVYDNTGLDWFLDWEDKNRPKTAAPPAFFIVCEALAELRPWAWGWRQYFPWYRISRGTNALKRVVAIMFEQTRRTRKDWFIDRVRDSRLNEGIIISMDVVARELREAKDRKDYEDLVCYSLSQNLVEKVRAIRIDLDCFLAEEAEILAYHGYWLTHIYLKTFHESTQVGSRPVCAQDGPEWKLDLSAAGELRYLNALRSSHKRFARGRRLW